MIQTAYLLVGLALGLITSASTLLFILGRASKNKTELAKTHSREMADLFAKWDASIVLASRSSIALSRIADALESRKH